MLTWMVVVALALGVYAQRAAGAVLIDTERLSATWQRVLEVLPLAIISGVVALATLSDDGELAVDARAVGVAVAAVCAWRKLPMFVTVSAAAITTAALRAAT